MNLLELAALELKRDLWALKAMLIILG